MKAIIFTEPKQIRLVTDRPLPPIRDNTVLVKVVTVALNPTDWKHVAFGMAKEGCVLGVDYAGVVEQSNSPGWVKGDRICGFAHGGNSIQTEDGTFAEYIVAPLFTAIKIPPGVSFEAASTLGCGITTVGQGLFEPGYGLGLNTPSKPITTQVPVLIYGGSSATGSLGIQFAKAAGYSVITTCSPKNFEMVRARGASEVFDTHDPEIGRKINDYTNNQLQYAWDCIGTDESARACANGLTTNPGAHYGTIRAPKLPRDDVKYTATMAYVGIGEDFEKGGNWTCNNEAHALWQTKIWKIAYDLLATGKIQVHPTRVENTGFEGILAGLKELENGAVSGQKLVYVL
ncbi:hypothetical protein PENANT_c003G04926 [Penicillium antarcticum]|uniref:Enoyl reductase (ER) domain-containing protein n=1 Tax=Penicillium antarcticum TaxID=416450 RepID=A0A1V6QHP8_9EURO|nr:uncharacterized protein N7508_005876 [Penicillium antarcticum]KAJ5306861.1 hypothetical protein N7508_005876 [Penicillium antarcticum]OQD88748.1 hypothetical protein PENANT_c003G04926 [Penicillium antarcticum]